MVELPMLPLTPVCPAAARIHGATPEQSGVVCRVMKREHELDEGTGMTAGQHGFIVHEAEGGVYLSLKSDPSSVVRFCNGSAMPVLHAADGQGRDSYTYCPVWQAERERILEGRRKVTRDVEPEPVSMGIGASSSLDAPDPWAQAQRDLDVLAPEA